ncbi:hypothetical protein KAZ66_00195 [Candidatus Woesebacteria bacterium]|nr:hypothetical protein [Candidatus Woesebacteria bacterium]
MALLPHQERVIEERKALDEKIQSLHDFLAITRSSSESSVLPQEMQRLSTQFHLMCAYSSLLQERINCFESQDV